MRGKADAGAQARAERRAAIDACPRCDGNGLVDVDASGSAVRHCDHDVQRSDRRQVRDWLADTEDRRDAIAERLAELDAATWTAENPDADDY